MGELKKYLFKGKLRGYPFQIEVEGIDRLHAITYLEACYPSFEWKTSEEIK